MYGLLSINKPTGMTSRDVVNVVQDLVRPAKVGHAGTLDPLATGVLVVCVGPATRLVQYIQELPKQYRAQFELGKRSDTDDTEGAVEEVSDAPDISREQLESLLPQFVGRIEQTPPVYSAVKVKGQRAYERARAGKPVELKPRPVTVYRCELTRFDFPRFSLDVECGAGTYIRAIGRDLGKALGSGAVMTALQRSGVGPFDVAQAIPLDQIDAETLPRFLQDPAVAFRNYPSYQAPAEEAGLFRQGQPLRIPGVGALPDGRTIAVLDHDARFVGVGEFRSRRGLVPRLVMPEAT
ncbi:tRNA pseudouridine synthase B [Maioricimonas rarisocia]|uniref:tRNA pseudouridine synthase B n=1 Tax=Maioricimonas rarisocia TaxID=2528026 RepID=A0A517Z4Q1_9PLAN|nr:tRNA pseudouridine(55) synthase TruB [Maioricimonas rarisocia]QDU37439.1 tRNA pseudouridine synthase B [Maioricimonas rarisocia]